MVFPDQTLHPRQGCPDTCTTDGDLTVCCPSVFCKGVPWLNLESCCTWSTWAEPTLKPLGMRLLILRAVCVRTMDAASWQDFENAIDLIVQSCRVEGAKSKFLFHDEKLAKKDTHMYVYMYIH